MAVTKFKDLAELKETQLQERLLELRKNLIKLNAQSSTGTAPQNPSQIKQIKRTIARIKTIMNQQKNKEDKLRK